MTQKTVVLTVDDDPSIRVLLDRALGLEGFQVEAAGSIREALDLVQRQPPDLVLLDVMLAGEDGLDLLSEIRRSHGVPVILLSGRADEGDRVLGLRMGADDYVVKPFSVLELAARITNVLRRAAAPTARSTRRSFGDLEIDEDSREIRRSGGVIETTAKEFDLLAYMTRSPRQVFSRQQLLEGVWDSSAEWQASATVTEHVRRLRLKIETDPEHPRWIVTIRGVGYRFEP
jgi:two-component system phosphate regulon response regulator PhoB